MVACLMENDPVVWEFFQEILIIPFDVSWARYDGFCKSYTMSSEDGKNYREKLHRMKVINNCEKNANAFTENYQIQ